MNKKRKFSRVVALVIVVLMILPTIAFAAADYTADATGGLKVSGTTTAASKEVTLLVVPQGQTPAPDGTNFKYIDQMTSGTDNKFEFNFKLSTYGTFDVFIGGEELSAPGKTLAENPTPAPTVAPTPTPPTDTPPPPPGVTVSGIAGPLTYYDGADDLNTAKAVIVNLKTSFLGTVKYSAIADNQTGAYSITNVADGDYVIEITKAGYMSRPGNVNVAGADQDLGNRPLVAGDVNGDYVLDSGDYLRVYELIGNDYDTEGKVYSPEADVNDDGVVDSGDYLYLYEVSTGNDLTAFYPESAEIDFGK